MEKVSFMNGLTDANAIVDTKGFNKMVVTASGGDGGVTLLGRNSRGQRPLTLWNSRRTINVSGVDEVEFCALNCTVQYHLQR